ncbi:MAG: class I SAM-dependent methyltransferase [Acidobacteriota bacterium]
MKLYDELSSWWPLLSPPEDYEEEAAFFARVFTEHSRRPVQSVLELGSGGGNNASFLKAHFAMTLVDVSPGMLEVSRALNPECEHIQGDMRRVRLGSRFDVVFVHDAICYMTSEDDLRRAVETVYLHCEPGGLAVIVPDYVRETFELETEHGGIDRGGRGMRYLSWVSDPDPSDTMYVVDFAYLLRETDGTVHVEHDRHVEGLFSRAQWLEILHQVGFRAEIIPYELASIDPHGHDVFVCTKPKR